MMNEGVELEEQVDEAVEEEQAVELVSRDEVERALWKMKAGKAVGPDEIPSEVWKIVEEKATTWLRGLFNKMLSGEQMPREWKVGLYQYIRGWGIPKNARITEA